MASSNCFSLAVAVCLVALAFIVSTEAVVHTLATCRLPINDVNRNYYLAQFGLSGTVACFHYRDVKIPNSGMADNSTVLAMGCQQNADGTTQLVLSPSMIGTCQQQLSKPEHERSVCNVLSSEFEPDSAQRRQGLRLTGQKPGSAAKLDGVYIAKSAFLCTESFGDSAAPMTQSRQCTTAGLRIMREADDHYVYTSQPEFSCNKILLHYNIPTGRK